MAKLEEVIQRGTRAAQPAANSVPVGTLYFVTDEFVIERSSGSAWESFSNFRSPTFKRTILIGNGTKTTTSTSFVAIDTTNLPYLTLTLAVGDVVRCILTGQHANSGVNYMSYDVAVDQPTSADRRIAESAEYGLMNETNSNIQTLITVIGLFTATEAGLHGFRPMWKVTAGTGSLYNETSGSGDTAIQFSVEKLGVPQA